MHCVYNLFSISKIMSMRQVWLIYFPSLSLFPLFLFLLMEIKPRILHIQGKGFPTKLFVLQIFITFLFGGVAPAMVYMWSSEDNLCKSVLSFYHVGPDDWIQVIRLMASAFSTWIIASVSVYPTPFFVVIETGLHYVAQVSLSLSMYVAHPPAPASQCGIKGMYHYTWPLFIFFI